jgi:hypothetical protein
MSFDDGTGYDLADPKHPTWAERMADRADDDRKRAKGEPAVPVPLFLCECDDLDCHERLDMTIPEYLDVRGAYAAHDGYYVVVHGHAQGTPVVLEGVLQSGDAYSVVYAPPKRP